VFVSTTHAQATSSQSWDIKVLHRIYEAPSPAFKGYMWAVDQTAYPAFYAGPLVAWGGTLLLGHSWRASYRLTLAHLGAAGSSLLLKRLLRRPRPDVVWSTITARRSSDIAGVNVKDPYAFPSGHTAVAFAMITSLSLSYPEWYVVAPGYTWAASIGLSRIWMGLHYPSDVLGGAVLGVALGVGVHALRQKITP